MTYRLVIVDDEEHIREGLNDLVDWQSLGFRVVAKLEDGKQVIDLLKTTEVDIILSDIKMSVVSGLELAQYVQQHHPETKIVLISGYKEFDLVKQAMNYNVVNYLLKPTKLPDIRAVFQEVKKKLDDEREAKERFLRVLEQNRELKPEIRKRLFRDLLAGGQQMDVLEVEKQLRLADVPADTRSHACALVRLSLASSGSASSDAIEPASVEAAVGMIHSESDDIMYIPVAVSSGNVYLVTIDLKRDREPSAFRTSATAYLQTVTQRIKAVLGIDATAETIRVYDHIEHLMKSGSADFAPRTNAAREPEQEPVSQAADAPYRESPQQAELRRKLFAYVQAGNFSALAEPFEQWLRLMEQDHAPLPAVKNRLVELFSALSGTGLPLEKVTNHPFNYETILRLNGYSDIRRWGSDILADLAAFAGDEHSGEPAAVRLAKEYVAQHLDKDITLEGVSAIVYLSPDYFSRVFKQHCGITFTDYVTQARIRKAMDYLRDPRFKIYEVGTAVGYRNTKYFYKQFKKQTGYTPSEYRRKSVILEPQ